MWPFRKKVKTDWLVRTAPVCDKVDCEFFMEMDWRLGTKYRFTGAVHPYIITCLMCSEFKRVSCYKEKGK